MSGALRQTGIQTAAFIVGMFAWQGCGDHAIRTDRHDSLPDAGKQDLTADASIHKDLTADASIHKDQTDAAGQHESASTPDTLAEHSGSEQPEEHECGLLCEGDELAPDDGGDTCGPCNDDNPCTDDGCSATQVCEYVPNQEPCNDGNPCTGPDACSAGECSGPLLPQDEVAPGLCPCLTDEDCAPLEDGDICNGTLYCDSLMLVPECVLAPATVVTCTGVPCSLGSCQPETGKCDFVPMDCDDNNECTQDACVQGSLCGNEQVADGTPCGVEVGAHCLAGTCVCDPDCEDKECGTDGCGGSCGSCPAGSECWATHCVQLPEALLLWSAGPGLGATDVWHGTMSGTHLVLVGHTKGPEGYTVALALDGTELWTRNWQGDDVVAPLHVGSDVAGNVYVGGLFMGTYLAAGEAVVANNGIGPDMFLAKLGPNGDHIWLKGFGGPNVDWLLSMSVFASGRLVATGEFYGSLDLGSGQVIPFCPAQCSPTPDSVMPEFLASLADDGSAEWSKAFSCGTALFASYAIASALPDGATMFFSPMFDPCVDLGGGVLASVSDGEVVAARFDAAGTHEWSKVLFPAPALSDFPPGHATRFGEGSIVASGVEPTMLRIDGDGTVMWFAQYATAESWGAVGGYDVVSDGEEAIYVVGEWSGQVDFGAGVSLASGSDAFVARLASDGTTEWVRTIGGDQDDIARFVGVASNGDMYVAVETDSPTLVISPGVEIPTDGAQAVLLKLAQ